MRNNSFINNADKLLIGFAKSGKNLNLLNMQVSHTIKD